MENFQGQNNFIEYMVKSFSYNDSKYHISYSNFLFDRFIVMRRQPFKFTSIGKYHIVDFDDFFIFNDTHVLGLD